ncbi:MAG: trypsin-like peptidase domain-containing protein [Planctomycetota bacterium]|jgi:serine protease Do
MNEENCARKWLGVWVAAIAIMVCVTIALAFYYADDIKQSQANRPPMCAGGFEFSKGRKGGNAQAANPGNQAALEPAAFVPPWHGEQNPDAVTGATPKPMAFNRAIQVVAPCIVGINASGETPQSGSGIIVHRIGYVLTNNHVIDGAKNLVVTLAVDQIIKSYSAEPVASEPQLDLAVIRIKRKGNETFSPAPLGDSGNIFIGQQVVTVGNPFGLSQSASAGIISNPRRSFTGEGRTFKDLIQTDASINPGSSGGALVNTNGEVIGVATAAYSPVQTFTGIGFAVPINQAKRVFRQFIEIVPSPITNDPAAGAQVNRGRVSLQVAARPQPELQMMATPTNLQKCWLGIDAYPIDGVMVREFNLPVRWGAMVNRVFNNSPASKAGLMRGDVVYRVNGKRIKNVNMFWSSLANQKAGDKIHVAIFRNNSSKTFHLTLEPEPPNIRTLMSKAPQGIAAEAAGEFVIEEISWIGLDIKPIGAGDAAKEFGIDPAESGVFVGEVEGIAAIEAGLLPGDVIKKINNKKVKGIEQFKDVATNIDPSKGVVLDIIRQKRPFYITIKTTGNDLGAWQ